MTIGAVQSAQDPSVSARSGNGPGTDQASQNRELAKAIRTINEGGGVGPNSELRFSIDEGTGHALIKIVDRVTDEVITQFPPEIALRAAELLKSLQSGERIA